MHLDRFGDKPRVIRAKRGLQLLLPAGGGGLRLTHQPAVSRGKVAIAKPLSSLGQTGGEVDVRRARPVLPKKRLDHGQRVGDPRQEWVTRVGVSDGELQDVREPPGAMFPQHRQPPSERPGHAGCGESGAGNFRKAHAANSVDGRRGRRRPLPAYHLRLAARHIPEHDRHLAAEAVQVRLDHLQDKPRRGRRVECVAAALEHRHTAL